MRKILALLLLSFIILPVLSCSPEMPMEMVFVKERLLSNGRYIWRWEKHPHPVFLNIPKVLKNQSMKPAWMISLSVSMSNNETVESNNGEYPI